MIKNVIITGMLIMSTIGLMSQTKNIELPQPDRQGGKPLMQALDQRSSKREFKNDALSIQQLSDLCWAAWGINRPETGRRTAPSSRNQQEMDLYVVLSDAAYIYNAQAHRLDFVVSGDLRALCGTQNYVGTAPVNFIFAADMTKRGVKTPEEITDSTLLSSWANAGFMSQNVYLVCASQGLGTVIRALIEREKLQEALQLKPMQRIILGQTIGLPQ